LLFIAPSEGASFTSLTERDRPRFHDISLITQALFKAPVTGFYAVSAAAFFSSALSTDGMLLLSVPGSTPAGNFPVQSMPTPSINPKVQQS